jgi:NAD(P)-dependent dehydrogenase (short-subunit alcohol dehydrogenase family)
VGALEGRVAIVTGAGGGLGREHALLLAAEGASVVVNDLATKDGVRLADSVVGEIVAAGGTAIASTADVADWTGARELVQSAIDRFGGLDALVNNAGIVRRGVIASMDEAEWDSVVNVHLRGHFAPTRWAAAYWRDEAGAGRQRQAAVVNTTSLSGLGTLTSPVHYAAAKAAVAQLTFNASTQLREFGVRVNAIAPAARTPMTEGTHASVLAAKDGEFDYFHAGNVSPLVGYLCTSGATETGRIYLVHGGFVGLLQPWHLLATIDRPQRWTIPDLAARMGELDVPLQTLPGSTQRYRPF